MPHHEESTIPSATPHWAWNNTTHTETTPWPGLSQHGNGQMLGATPFGEHAAPHNECTGQCEGGKMYQVLTQRKFMWGLCKTCVFLMFFLPDVRPTKKAHSNVQAQTQTDIHWLPVLPTKILTSYLWVWEATNWSWWEIDNCLVH